MVPIERYLVDHRPIFAINKWKREGLAALPAIGDFTYSDDDEFIAFKKRNRDGLSGKAL